MARHNTLFLTGLRGYSALAVFLIHSGGGGLRGLGEWGGKLVDFGKYGVISFFVLSALTLAISIDKTPNFSYGHYLLRRFARIFPIYAIVVSILWWMGGAVDYREMFNIPSRDIGDLIAHLSFMNAWDIRYQNTVIGVEWTVPIEMWLYLLIPPLFFIFLRAGSIWKWMIFITAVIVSLKAGKWHQSPLGLHWAIESYIYCFIGGMFVFFSWEKIKLSTSVADQAVVVVLFAIIGLSQLTPSHVEQWLTIFVMMLILMLSRAHIMTHYVFENKAIIVLGNISFPFYLLHLPILRFMQNSFGLSSLMLFVDGLLVCAVLAFACHKLIERPVLRLTGKLHPYDR